MGENPRKLAVEGGKSFWSLVPFTMQIAMIIIGGFDNVFQVSASSSAAKVPSATEIESLDLKRTALKPGQVTAGVIWFERSAHARELSLRVSVTDLVFDFPLFFDQRK
jgi:hypothetical protein